MNKLNQALLIVILAFSVLSAPAQDTLLLISGKKIIASSVDIRDNKIAYKKNTPDSKLKTIDPERVFSIIYKDGREQLIYQSDSLDPIDFKVEEMRSFITGEQDAMKYYKNNVVKGMGIIIGGSSALLGFYGIIIPPLYSTIVGSFSPDVKKTMTFKVGGSASGKLGIAPQKYNNEVSGKILNPVLTANDRLKLARACIKTDKETSLDSAVSLINSRFNCHRVNAANDNSTLHLYRTLPTSLLDNEAYREGFEKKVRDYKIKNAMLYGIISFISGSIALSIMLKDDNNNKEVQ